MKEEILKILLYSTTCCSMLLDVHTRGISLMIGTNITLFGIRVMEVTYVFTSALYPLMIGTDVTKAWCSFYDWRDSSQSVSQSVCHKMLPITSLLWYKLYWYK